jgi:hypothetical protein
MEDQHLKNFQQNRRLFIKTLAGIGIGVVANQFLKVSHAAADTCSKVSPKNPMVDALAYVDKSATKGQNCANCVQFQGKPKDKTGKCPIFQGCEVTASGWCKSWAKKA